MEALQDLSAAIHLEPNGAQAFFHRGYLLRDSQPWRALKDFSVSLLLDDSVTNVNSFIHRGVLYTQLQWSGIVSIIWFNNTIFQQETFW